MGALFKLVMGLLRIHVFMIDGFIFLLLQLLTEKDSFLWRTINLSLKYRINIFTN